MYAEVYLPIAVNHTFSYLIPEKLEKDIKKGTLVGLPFGRRTAIGYVNNIVQNKEYLGKIKSIDAIFSNSIKENQDIIELIDWMSRYYLTSKGLVVKSIFPFLFSRDFKNLKKEKEFIITNLGKKTLEAKQVKGLSRKRILESIKLEESFISLKKLKDKIQTSNDSIKTLLRDKYISVKESSITYDPLLEVRVPNRVPQLKLSKEQDKIFKELETKINNDCFSVNLIHGVTGSGKTEIYIKLVEKLLKQNKTALILVPEIVLTPETAKRFKLYFRSQVGIWNSGMTNSEKKWTWNNLKNQNLKIIIGTRSSVFLPIKNLSLIIVDEEHDASYKQAEGMPAYNARDIAIIRSKNLNIPAILGSATPSIESYYNSSKGKYNLFELMERYGSATYPSVELVNMFDEENKDQIFSQKLLDSINSRLRKKEQIILLHNRRGYASMLYCSECGYVFTSSKTSVPLTYHKTYNQLVCHHTDERYSIPEKCIDCGSNKLLFKGIGTEQIEAELSKFFPSARISRFDADSTSKKNAYKQILKDFDDYKSDILIGTQMVSKGFDFHNVTLVGVLNADIGLFSPDFRSSERIFQLLYQVCGRSGRGEKKGKAIIQSYNTNDPYIMSSSIMDTKKYYNILMADRLELDYPPFSKIIRILLKGKNIKDLEKTMNPIINFLNENKFTVLGPTLAPIEKINNLYRYHIIVKSDKPLRLQDAYLKNKKLNDYLSKLKRVRYQFDIDPLSLL
ncbi:MAG: primosomal protein N' [Candidatus Marinimicrobia bacterium]|nr:primosomal protein N' [Candidatus Neomarinimicrobiota bacterium]|tara:strand:- start:37808 stop:40012 length:2205 start_codon:yes stop_codon:yes gene_type:complete